MQCVQCQASIDESVRFCSHCGAEQTRACSSCGQMLKPQDRFCSGCGQAAASSSGVGRGEASERFCAGTGKPIRPEDTYFKCVECNRFYLEPYRFEDKPVCQSCAFESGMAQALAEERQQAAQHKAEQGKAEQIRIEAERRQRLEQIRIEAERRLEAERHARETEQRARDQAERKAREVEERRRSEQLKLAVSEDDWVDIPAGEFLMGSPEHERGRSSYERQHRVWISAFKMLKTPVTFAMFDAFCEATGREFPEDEDWGRLDRPVIDVGYWDAVDYAEWLSKQTGWQLRLPTEAEWEYACRAGTTTAYWMGNTINQSQANYGADYFSNDEVEKANAKSCTTLVGYYQANPWGLYDMLGNVWEHCASEYDEEYGGLEQRDASQDRSDEALRVARGGSWSCQGTILRAASRSWTTPGGGGRFDVGFRLVRI